MSYRITQNNVILDSENVPALSSRARSAVRCPHHEGVQTKLCRYAGRLAPMHVSNLVSIHGLPLIPSRPVRLRLPRRPVVVAFANLQANHSFLAPFPVSAPVGLFSPPPVNVLCCLRVTTNMCLRNRPNLCDFRTLAHTISTCIYFQYQHIFYPNIDMCTGRRSHGLGTQAGPAPDEGLQREGNPADVRSDDVRTLGGGFSPQ